MLAFVHFLAFVQDGDEFRWAVPFNDIAAANPGMAAGIRERFSAAGRA